MFKTIGKLLSRPKEVELKTYKILKTLQKSHRNISGRVSLIHFQAEGSVQKGLLQNGFVLSFGKLYSSEMVLKFYS